jgi:ribosomal protein S18 acetylase RimI-like enzyme
LSDGLTIVDVSTDERDSLDTILVESFKGLYLWHARRTLREIELVRAARIDGEYAGLAMLKRLDDEVGYIYYIAVAQRHRRKGVGGQLLRDALSHFSSIGSKEAYASIEEDNVESAALFGSMGFRKTSYEELSMKYGKIRALDMYRRMLVVPGETLFCKALSA